jgi:LacI family transcriptional regulator
MKRIAVIWRTGSWYSRAVVHGLNKFALGKDWVFHIGPATPQIIALVRHWKADGVIAHISLPEISAGLRTLRKSVVNIASKFPELKFPRVGIDSRAIGQMAADHFLQQGFQNFAFYGLEKSEWSKDRELGFRRQLAEAGHSRVHSLTAGLDVDDVANWVEFDKRVTGWLRTLPKPVGIFACNDIKSHELALMCRLANISVPEEVALLGVDNDPVICDNSWLSLSSIALPLERLGFEAGAMLDRLMQGKRPPKQPILLPPVRVIVRQSTEILAIDVPEVARALRFIRDHAFGAISVRDISRAAAVNRRRLERMFRRQLGRTPHQEIARVRVERAKQLLSSTNLPMPLVAERAGFESARRLTENFRVLTGTSPSAYRRQFQLRDDT